MSLEMFECLASRKFLYIDKKNIDKYLKIFKIINR